MRPLAPLCAVLTAATLTAAISACGTPSDTSTAITAPTPATTPPTTQPASTAPPTTVLQVEAPASVKPAPPDRSTATQAAPTMPPPTTTTTMVVYPDTPCSEWYPTALAAGFSHDEWMSTVARVMWAESRCDPNADNGVCCIGLMQIHRGVWGCASFDPFENLVCARYVQRVQGWSAWVTY